jgi:hypothetical protein
METALIVRGKISNARHIELDEAVPGIDGEVEIYLIEASSPFHAAVVQRIAAHASLPGATLVTSRLARPECRTKPLREASADLWLATKHSSRLGDFGL